MTAGPTREDAGFTLVELLVASALTVLVLLVTGTIMTQSLRVQATVQSLGDASNGAQLVVRSLQRGLGNASAFKAEAPTAAGQLLRARTAVPAASGAPTWRCVAWYWSSTAGTLRTTSSTTGAVPVPTNTALASWARLATQVSLPSGTTQPFTASGSQLQLRIGVGAGTGARPVLVSTTVATAPQSDSTTAPATCF